MTTYHSHKHQKARKTLIVRKTVKPLAVDRLIYIAAIVEPLFSLPQSYHIFSTKSAADISIITWVGFELMTLIWIWYGIVHKEKTILIYQSLFFIIDGSVVVGALLYS
jgi:uncharacterized protein with PQ loop repeat